MKASGGADKTIIFWDLRDSKPFQAILAHSSIINSLDFSHDNNYLMSAAGDGYWFVKLLIKFNFVKQSKIFIN